MLASVHVCGFNFLPGQLTRCSCVQTRPQEATFLASLLHHQPQLRPTVDALLRSNLLPALHASLPSRRSGAGAAAAQPSSPVSASSAASAVARPSFVEDRRRTGAMKAATAAPASVQAADAVNDVAATTSTDVEEAAQRRQAVAAAAEDKEVCPSLCPVVSLPWM